MKSEETGPIDPQDYADSLMSAFDDVAYVPAEVKIPESFEESGIGITNIQKRSRTKLDPEQQATWTLEDYRYETELLGRPDIDRLIILKKETTAGKVHLRLWGSRQKVAIMAADYELPADFNSRDEFLRGLRVLAGDDNVG